MHTYEVNIARINRVTTRYEHWGRVTLGDCNESEARTKFDRLVAAFPAPGFHLMLQARPLQAVLTLATNPGL